MSNDGLYKSQRNEYPDLSPAQVDLTVDGLDIVDIFEADGG